ncbi:hypothetical protein CFIO01_03689 [Colletotrichum fioriniae PJ7]|uniref:Uncharacterized protein n=1 Tax=Colletotrichum fioriniae PJ7 TaxID=1445577 RepID=A0A010QI03_9PEZI|nr:hypothetical protein CFIO01_03689 [Colletotrichum fioriniae PJ7]
MEAVSAAASVAGLLSVAGHVLNGLVKLNAFIQDMKEADGRAQRLTTEARLLTKTLTDFKSLLNTLDEKTLAESRLFWEQYFNTFSSRLEDCVRDLDAWTDTYQPDGPSSKRRKIMDGLSNKRGREISGMESKLARHRSQIVLDLNTMNAWISLGGLDKIDAVHEAVRRLTGTNLQMNQENIDRSNIVFKEATRERQHLTDTILSTTHAFKQQVVSDHHETQSQLSRLSDSVSSIAESLQQLANSAALKLPRRGSDCHPKGLWGHETEYISSEMDKNKKRRHSESTTSGDQPESQTSRFVGRTGWTCGGAIGIDDFFIECQEDQHFGQTQCVLCGRRFSSMESLVQSRHIADYHDFAGCDQGRHFLSKTNFVNHLRESHAADRIVSHRHPTHFEKIFFCNRFSIVDERIRSLYGKPRKLEIPTTPLILQSKLQHLISEFVDVKTMTPHGAYSLRALGQPLEALSQLVFSATSSPKLAATLYQAANLAEELSITCNRTFGKRWIPTPSILLQRISTVQGNDSVNLDLKDTGQGMTCPSWCPDTSTEWEVLAPGLKISSLMATLRAGTSRREKIDLWMLDILHKSEYLLVVLRCSAFFGSSSSFSSTNDGIAQTERDGATCSLVWGSMWTHDLLEAFESKEGAMEEDDHPIQSDGAVYSPGNTAWPRSDGDID